MTQILVFEGLAPCSQFAFNSSQRGPKNTFHPQITRMTQLLLCVDGDTLAPSLSSRAHRGAQKTNNPPMTQILPCVGDAALALRDDPETTTQNFADYTDHADLTASNGVR